MFKADKYSENWASNRGLLRPAPTGMWMSGNCKLLLHHFNKEFDSICGRKYSENTQSSNTQNMQRVVSGFYKSRL